MSKSSNRSLVIAFLYLIALLAISFYRDKSVQPGLWIQVPELLTLHINSDPKTFASAGLEMSRTGWLAQESIWILHLWPPGFVVLLAGIFAIFGGDAPYLFVLLMLSLLMGAAMLMVVRRYLLIYVSEPWATFLPLVPFAFPVTRFFLLQPLGLAFGEGFSVMFFITACFLVLLAVEAKAVRPAVVAGFFLALAAYFRSQYELLVAALCVAVVPIIIWRIFGRFALKKAMPKKNDRLVILSILISVGVAQLVMLPWRINNYFDIGSLGWVQTSEIVARNGLASDQKLREIGGSFVLIGGGNLACKFEPTYCDKSDPALFYKAFFQNISGWLAYKANLASEFWFPTLAYFPRPVDKEVPAEYFSNGIILLLIPAIGFFLNAIRRSSGSQIYAWLLMSFSACFFVIFALVQFEVRYFFLAKIFVLFMAVGLAAAAWSTRFGVEVRRIRSMTE